MQTMLPLPVQWGRALTDDMGSLQKVHGNAYRERNYAYITSISCTKTNYYFHFLAVFMMYLCMC